jgi:hypothetical protein
VLVAWLASSSVFCGGYVLGAGITRRKVEEEWAERKHGICY